jgi:branched-subunit amino acid ABC-type transport system permease component
MTALTQYIITGLAVGMIYALIGLGFVLIWKSSSVANLALGQLVLVCSWFAYSMDDRAVRLTPIDCAAYTLVDRCYSGDSLSCRRNY